MSTASSCQLLAAWKVIGERCGSQNQRYFECKSKDGNAAACVADAKEVISCTDKVIADLVSRCGKQFAAYEKCLDFNGHNFEKCRSQQAAFEKCAGVKSD
ncbi:mitochondrial Complex I (CI) NADH:ubiquinone oxidoreductase subunit PGIV/NUPM/NDUFA8/20.8-kDa [Andalucia godoyi]|uniref:Mitochondrial Complex I (CI) NADH:ubiquinone oxidoreductase subunit PGIV/NUPM/NDUFA8/20.8-kDa n=1 Tax=Andalucia godoyi TaxID=505711 RepID=A0A8K0AIC5_ANDGO|nr:mitochondrial Complex I (CI) NADH:ubiquinone oxidoreductase subunit PGIV/NUPM/NDUFA8/20.8-kDa [Andalucia godoyi]|eukprot:ANDGO_02262.mRNA.1 mitochondrial Complex I (CI) NADH:ubiquinone oxidoreductase subunit PGIV/NUPM/NDUFA8/20.8-kDa